MRNARMFKRVPDYGYKQFDILQALLKKAEQQLRNLGEIYPEYSPTWHQVSNRMLVMKKTVAEEKIPSVEDKKRAEIGLMLASSCREIEPDANLTPLYGLNNHYMNMGTKPLSDAEIDDSIELFMKSNNTK